MTYSKSKRFTCYDAENSCCFGCFGKGLLNKLSLKRVIPSKFQLLIYAFSLLNVVFNVVPDLGMLAKIIPSGLVYHNVDMKL
jgi:hypothetical protein